MHAHVKARGRYLPLSLCLIPEALSLKPEVCYLGEASCEQDHGCTVLQCWGDSHMQPCQGVLEILTRDGVFAQVVLLCPELPSQFS